MSLELEGGVGGVEFVVYKGQTVGDIATRWGRYGSLFHAEDNASKVLYCVGGRGGLCGSVATGKGADVCGAAATTHLHEYDWDPAEFSEGSSIRYEPGTPAAFWCAGLHRVCRGALGAFA